MAYSQQLAGDLTIGLWEDTDREAAPPPEANLTDWLGGKKVGIVPTDCFLSDIKEQVGYLDDQEAELMDQVKHLAIAEQNMQLL
jgi:hypothetical protein